MRKNTLSRRRLGAFIASGFVFVSGVIAAAQSANVDASATATDEKVYRLSPFQVTASVSEGYRATNSVSGSRVNLDLQSLPQTISVVTEEFMRDINAFDIDEAVKYTAGINAAEFFGSRFNLRGFNVGSPKKNGFIFGVNGTYDSINTERIEVVKGPSGVLYGVGTPGGVVNIVTKRPQEKPRSYLKATASDRQSIRTEMDFTGPLTAGKEFLYRLTASYQEQYSHLKYGERQAIFIAPSVQWKLNDRPIPTTINVSLESIQVPHMVSADERIPIISKLSPAPLGNNPNRQIQVGYMFVPGLPEDFNFAGPNATREERGTYLEATIDHSFMDNLNLRVAALSYDYELERVTQFANGQLQYNAQGQLPSTIPVSSFYGFNNYKRQSAQADLSWELETKIGKLNLIGGAFYTDGDTHLVDYRDNTRPAFNLFNPGPADFAIKPYPNPAYTRAQDTWQYSSYKAWWTVINAETPGKRFNFLGGFRKEGVLENFQGGFSYYLTRKINVIYSYTESGQANSFFPDTPQTGKGQEVGVRYSLLDGRLSGGLSAFKIENSNIQRRDPNIAGSVYVLSGLEESKGVEFELFYFPNDDWKIVFNAIKMSPKVKSNVTAPFTEGTLIDNAPEVSINAYVRRTFNKGALKGFYLAAGVNHQSETRPFGSNAGLYLLEQPAFTTLNLSTGYSFRVANKYRWSFDLSIKNALDEFYYVKSAIPAEFRTILGSVSVSF